MAVRTVRVRLELDRGDLQSGLQAAASEVRAFDGEVHALGEHAERTGVELKGAGKDIEGVGDSAKKAGDKARQLGDDVEGMGSRGRATTLEFDASMAKLHDRIKSLTDESKLLREEWAHTGDITFLDKAKGLDSEIGKLSKYRAELHNLREDLAGGGIGNNAQGGLLNFAFDEWAAKLASATGQGIKSGLSSVGQAIDDNPVISTAIIVGVTAALPVITATIGAAIGSGVALGFGGGVIATGIKLASEDSRVDAAWSSFGDKAKAALSDAAGPFVQPLVDGARTVGDAFTAEIPHIDAAFATLAPVVGDLADGAAGFIRAIGPGLDALAHFSAPFLQDLASWLPELGAHLKEFIDKVTNSGPGAEKFFNDLLNAVISVVDALGDLVNWGSRAYLVLSAVGDAATGHFAQARQDIADLGNSAAHTYGGFTNDTINADTALGLLHGTMERAADGTVRLKDNAKALAAALDQANTASHNLLGTWMSADQAAIQLNQTMLALKESVKQNGTSLAENTEKGLANRSALLSIADAAENKRQRDLAAGASLDYVNGQYASNMSTLRANAIALHFNAGEVDALIGKYRQVPGDVNTNITLYGVDTSINEILAVKQQLNSLQNKTVTITTVRNIVTGQTSTVQKSGPVAFNRYGGVMRYADGGIDYRARSGILVPSDPGTILAGEPQTGGEAFIPRLGISDSRGLALANTAAAWHGGQVVPNSLANARPGYAGAAGTANGRGYVDNRTVTYAIYDATDPGKVVAAIKAYERDNGKAWRDRP